MRNWTSTSLLFCLACGANTPVAQEAVSEPKSTEKQSPTSQHRRVPAEWEAQAATWMQWPHAEERSYEPVFVKVIFAITQHQPVQLVTHSPALRQRAEKQLQENGVDLAMVRFHQAPTDSAWMRDNGPRYVLVNGGLVAQNWPFDAWGGNFGVDIPYENDDRIPSYVANYLQLPLENYPLVHERGDLEFNGKDTLMVNWSVVGQRNPGWTREETTKVFKSAFGVTSVIYLNGFHPEDGTTGHTDGLARFISKTEIVVGQVIDPETDPTLAQLFEDVTQQIKAQRPNLTVHRLQHPAEAGYMNWLVGNGFVLLGATGFAEDDQTAQKELEKYFPGRKIYLINTNVLGENGGGIHCVTNDQPAVGSL